MDSHGDIAANLARVRARIQAAARRAGRDPAEVTLVAVTKTRPLDAMQAAYRAGVRNFGENRVEEASLKIPAFNDWAAAERPTWHMIGHLQSRKAADALANFDMVHSVDSLKLAERLSRLAEGADRTPLPILLECNVSGEASKYGFELSHWQASREICLDFFDVARTISRLPRLRLQGLMTMAPLVAEPEQARPVFAALRLLRAALAEEVPGVEWRHLSMGMTDDFEVAVEEGATLVRVGRALFEF